MPPANLPDNVFVLQPAGASEPLKYTVLRDDAKLIVSVHPLTINTPTLSPQQRADVQIGYDEMKQLIPAALEADGHFGLARDTHGNPDVTDSLAAGGRGKAIQIRMDQKKVDALEPTLRAPAGSSISGITWALTRLVENALVTPGIVVAPGNVTIKGTNPKGP